MKIKFAIGLMLVLALVSCQNSGNGKNDKPVAAIYDKVL